jgi:integrase/recombinase XerD
MADGGVAVIRPVIRLEQSLADYLQLRRSLGHQLADAGRLLPGFVAFLDDRGLSTVTVAAAMEWAALPAADPRSSVGPRRMVAVRGFARYLAGVDPATEVPPLGLLPHPTRWRGPFVFAPADIDLIMTRVGDFTPPLRSATYVTLIGLLAATGLRIGEAIKLDRADIDWSAGVLLIRESKFGKSRLVPVTDTTLQALADYAGVCDQMQRRVRQPSFFTSRTSRRLCYAAVSEAFRTVIDDSGIGADAPRRPRLHDLRHTFAVRTLLGWYRSGGDVQAKIPALSTYLGHREPCSTYWYLSAVPELLACAAARQGSRQGSSAAVTS